MSNKLVISQLGHTWIIDLDGTIVKHNGYKQDGEDSFLEGAKHFLDSIPKNDMIIIITSRSNELETMTELFLKRHGVRFDQIIFSAPYGERILINDDKPSGMRTALCVGFHRDQFPDMQIILDKDM